MYEHIDPKGTENKICTMIKKREAFRAATGILLTPAAMKNIKFWKGNQEN